MWVSVLPACIFRNYLHAWCPQRAENSDGSYGTGVIVDWEPPWESNTDNQCY